MDSSDTEQRARSLCQSLTNGIAKSNLSTITTSIYDTAWLSMISKVDGLVERWLFPESFDYLLSHQLCSGGWESYATEKDGILNSLAALLALMKHRDRANPSVNLEDAIQRAFGFLERSLVTLQVDGGLPVGFEILMPALLAMLEKDGVQFSFPAKESLLAINKTKTMNFTPDLLYSTRETTLLHSLEAFIGKINFDRIRHRKVFGSMMASPASTAAYLMNLSSWDEESELYLRRVILEGSGKGNGAVPSAFPTLIFEVSWVNPSF